MPADRSTNLAPFGIASASSSVPGYEPNRSNDRSFDTRWNAAVIGPNEWYEIDWASPQRFHSITVRYGKDWADRRTSLGVQIWDAATSSWKTIASKGDGKNPLPPDTEVSFPHVTTTKIRLTNVVTFRELEVYGHIQGSFITGKVTEKGSNRPVSDTTVSAGTQTTTTDRWGAYALGVTPGNCVVTATKPPYQLAKVNVTVPTDGVVLANMQFALHNLAPLGIAKAKTAYSDHGPRLAIDGRPDTLWSATDNTSWYEIDWDRPQTFNTVVIYFCPASFPETSFHYSRADKLLWVEAWDSTTSSWISVKRAGDGCKALPMTITVQFPNVTSSKIRINPVTALWEVEVLGGTDVSQACR